MSTPRTRARARRRAVSISRRSVAPAAATRGGMTRYVEPLENRLMLAIITSLVDPLTGPAVDTTKWTITDRGLEQNGPAGYNPPTQDANGLTLGGTANNQYWYGSSVESVDEFSSQSATTVEVDRVFLAGSGSAWRSSLWLFQPSGQYLHFSQNQGESGWSYNQSGTVNATGSGIAVPAFNAVANNPDLHEMKLAYRPVGGTNAAVDIYLDDQLGATATFNNWDNNVPFKVIMTGQARAGTPTGGDSVAAIFKDFTAEVPAAGPAAPSNLTATAAPRGNAVTLQWRDNATNEINYRVERSTDGVNFTEAAIAPGGDGSGSTLTFIDRAPATSTTFTYRVRAYNDFNNGSLSGPSNTATATTPAHISSLSDSFVTPGIDTNKWDVTERGLENTGPAGYTANQETNGLNLFGTATAEYWYGASVESKDLFLSQARTTVSVDRVAMTGTGTAWRSSLWLLQPVAGGQFLHFSQNINETGWSYNQTAGNIGTAMPALNTAFPDQNQHNMKVVYTPLGGTNATFDMYVDDVLGGTARFTNWDTSVPFKVILTGQARAVNDTVFVVYQNFNAAAEPQQATAPAAPTNLTATARPAGGVDLQWTDNANNEVGFSVERSVDGVRFTEIAAVNPANGTGTTVSYIDNTAAFSAGYFYRVRAVNYAPPGVAVGRGNYSAPTNLVGTATPDPQPSQNTFSDTLTGPTVDTTKWDITNRGLEANLVAGYNEPAPSPDGVTLGGTTTHSYWAGKSLETRQLFDADEATSVSVDRVSLSGSGSAYRSSLWLLQDGGPYLHFSQNVGELGWTFNPNNTGTGSDIVAFNGLDGDQGLHNMKVIYTPLGGNNARFQLFLDDIAGPVINYTNWNNATPFKVILTGQARENTDSVSATFRNVVVEPPPVTPTVVAGSELADTFHVRRNADGINADVWVNAPTSGAPTMQVPVGQAGALIFDGLGGNDVLTVDYTTGNPAPAGGIRFNGGAGADNLVSQGAGPTPAPGDASGVFGRTVTHTGGGTTSTAADVERLTLAGGTYSTPIENLTAAGGFSAIDVRRDAALQVVYNGASPVAAVRNLIRTGYGGGFWNGNGITSSDAAANAGFGLGYTDSGNVITVRYTRAGDATLDGSVDFNDLAALAQNYNNLDGNRTWPQGDFTYDGAVDFNDLALLAQNYNLGPAAALAAFAPAPTPVPAKPAKPAKPVAKAPAPAARPIAVVAQRPFASGTAIRRNDLLL